MAAKAKSVVRSKSEGTAIWFLGSLFDIKATGEETDGSLTVVEITVAPKSIGAPPHTHDCGESVYIVDGKLKFHIDGGTTDTQAGSYMFFPAGTLEWFENETATPARVLLTYTRPGIAKFFKEVGEPAKARTLPPPPSGPPDFAKLAAVAQKYGLELQQPPKH